MKIYFKKECPVCSVPLTKQNHSSFSDNDYTCGNNIDSHYYSYQADGLTQCVDVGVPGFLIRYWDNFETDIYILKPARYTSPEDIKPHYEWIFTLPFYLELDWKNLKKTSDRLKMMVVFS